jgi:DNA-binding response OmpR family regulator
LIERVLNFSLIDRGEKEYRLVPGDLASLVGHTMEPYRRYFAPREYDILRLLIRCRGELVTHNRLLNDVWGYEAYPTTRTVDNHILKLRKKLEHV